VVHTCKPSYTEAELGGSVFEASPGKIINETLNKNKLDVVVHMCNLRYVGGRVGGLFEAGMGKKHKTLMKNS
jgi:hypothetical protein